ncbi:MAG: hypothetical protein QM764_09470 [Chitinophagaceae bacterium]
MIKQDLQRSIRGLRAKLTNRIKRYDKALIENAGFNVRKSIRTEIRRLQQDITVLKNSLRQTAKSQ